MLATTGSGEMKVSSRCMKRLSAAQRTDLRSLWGNLHGTAVYCWAASARISLWGGRTRCLESPATQVVPNGPITFSPGRRPFFCDRTGTLPSGRLFLLEDSSLPRLADRKDPWRPSDRR